MNQVVTQTNSDLMIAANAIAKSGLFSIKTPEQAMALMLIAQAEGRHPAEAARDYNIIQGRPSKTSDAMLRDFLASGGRVEWHSLTDTLADATLSHAQGGSVRINWDMKRANAAGLGGKDMWKKYPRQMLRARVISEGIRTIYPAATSGMYVPEEVRDFEPKQDDNIIDVQSSEVANVPQVEAPKSRINPNSNSQFEKSGKPDAWMKSFSAAKTISQLLDIWGACREDNEKAAFADTTQDYVIGSAKDLLGLKDDIDELRTEIEFLKPRFAEVPFGSEINRLMRERGLALKAAQNQEAA